MMYIKITKTYKRFLPGQEFYALRSLGLEILAAKCGHEIKKHVSPVPPSKMEEDVSTDSITKAISTGIKNAVQEVTKKKRTPKTTVKRNPKTKPKPNPKRLPKPIIN